MSKGISASELRARWGPDARYCKDVCGLEVIASVTDEGESTRPAQVAIEWFMDLPHLPHEHQAGMDPVAAYELARKLKRGAKFATRGRPIRESVFLNYHDTDEICVLVDGAAVCLCYSMGGSDIATFQEFVRLDADEAVQVAEALEAAYSAIEKSQ